jgi:hypothetical protein
MVVVRSYPQWLGDVYAGTMSIHPCFGGPWLSWETEYAMQGKLTRRMFSLVGGYARWHVKDWRLESHRWQSEIHSNPRLSLSVLAQIGDIPLPLGLRYSYHGNRWSHAPSRIKDLFLISNNLRISGLRSGQVSRFTFSDPFSDPRNIPTYTMLQLLHGCMTCDPKWSQVFNTSNTYINYQIWWFPEIGRPPNHQCSWHFPLIINQPFFDTPWPWKPPSEARDLQGQPTENEEFAAAGRSLVLRGWVVPGNVGLMVDRYDTHI